MNSIIGEQLVEAAKSFLGVPFRLHGRDPQTGLDCVGLVDVSLRAIGIRPILPRGYRLRNLNFARWLSCAERSGLLPTSGHPWPGDIVLSAPSAGQCHLMIASEHMEFIHAHAGLRKVVCERAATNNNIVRHWRLLNDLEE